MLVRRIGGVLGCRFRILHDLVWSGILYMAWWDAYRIFKLSCKFTYLGELLTVYKDHEMLCCLPSLRNIL